MTLIVSDTNVFVALHKSGLLFKVFTNTRVKVVIPNKIYEELTGSGHRIAREHPDLTRLIRATAFNTTHSYPISIEVRDILHAHALEDIAAIRAWYELDEDAILDPGEMEAIPLAIELSAIFLSCEQDALNEFNALACRNSSVSFHFRDYCQDLFKSGLLKKNELEKIFDAMK